jgi:hypothetical protein
MFVSAYDVGQVSIVFNDMKMYIQFFSDDMLMGCVIAARAVSCPWGFDEGIAVTFKGKSLISDFERKERFDEVAVFERIIKEVDSNENFYELCIEFKKENTYDFQKNNIYFIIDRDHEDDYFFELEASRRLKSR